MRLRRICSRSDLNATPPTYLLHFFGSNALQAFRKMGNLSAQPVWVSLLDSSMCYQGRYHSLPCFSCRYTTNSSYRSIHFAHSVCMVLNASRRASIGTPSSLAFAKASMSLSRSSGVIMLKKSQKQRPHKDEVETVVYTDVDARRKRPLDITPQQLHPCGPQRPAVNRKMSYKSYPKGDQRIRLSLGGSENTCPLIGFHEECYAS